jgi:hypothetical protein
MSISEAGQTGGKHCDTRAQIRRQRAACAGQRQPFGLEDLGGRGPVRWA